MTDQTTLYTCTELADWLDEVLAGAGDLGALDKLTWTAVRAERPSRDGAA